MPYSHKRSKEATHRRQQKRNAVSYVWQTSFNDRIIHEIVCTTTTSKIDEYIKSKLSIDEPQVFFADSSGFEQGLILANQLQYEYHVNRPSDTKHSDLENLHPIENYQIHSKTKLLPSKPVVGFEPLGWVGRNIITVTQK